MNHDIIKFIDNIDYKDIEFKYKEFDLILSGGGLKGFYHIGMCKILKQYEKEGKIKIRNIVGTSTGALTAIIYASNYSFEGWYESYYTIKENIGKTDLHQTVINILKKNLPKDAYKLCSNRVKICLSKITLFGIYKEIVDKFDSNDHLINVLSAAIKVPYVTSNNIYPENIKGSYYCDGFFVGMTPIIYDNDIPQLLVETHKANYSTTMSLKPQDSYIELLSLRGLYE